MNGIDLCWFEWGAEFRKAGTTLLIHATGFHARCWDATVGNLGDRHVIAVDMRGHGRSEKKAPYTWDVFGRDLSEFVKALNLSNIVGAGHSMGGHSLCQAVAAEQARFSRFVLVDPVILSPEAYARFEPTRGEAHPVSRRRNLFASPEALFENLRTKGSYGLWEERVLHDYCHYGVLPNPEGPGYVLACPPLVEAAIYTGNAGTDIYPLLPTIEIPVTVLRARTRDENDPRMDFSRSPTWPGLAKCFKQGRDVYLPEFTHFIPMQSPALVAAHISGAAM